MVHAYSGKLISFEGIDGSGKSTLAILLTEALAQRGVPVALTREHGGTPLGVHLRALLHNRKDPMCSKSEFLILAADRAQHFDQVVVPALSDGKLVISDRMDDSSLAYQGYGRGLDLEMISTINHWAMGGIQKDLVFFIDIDPLVAVERFVARKEQLTAFEQEKIDFWQRVRDGYHEVFKNRSEVMTLDGRNSPEQLLRQALDALHRRGIVSL